LKKGGQGHKHYLKTKKYPLRFPRQGITIIF